jgi:small-conductance mechanosensitive channel
MKPIERLLAEHPAELLWPSIVFVVILATGWGVRRLVLKALYAWAEHSQSRAGLLLINALKGPVLIWTVILGAHIAMQASDLPVKVTNSGAEILYVLWIASATIVLMRLAGNLGRYYGDQAPGALPVTTLSHTLVQIAILILAVVVVMDHFNRSITPILTALGVGGLAVALALQDTLSNLFGGFYVAVARQIRLGDYIKLNTGEEGYVGDIGWRSTTIRALANNLVIVPNAKLAQAIVTNYSLPERRISVSLKVGVSYQSDADRVERLLLEIAVQGAQDIDGLLADPPPQVVFDPGFGDSALEFTINFQVAEFNSQFAVRNELRRRIWRRFLQESIEIPYPTRAVRLEGAKPNPPAG